MPKMLLVFAVAALLDCGSEEEAATPAIANVEGEVAVEAAAPTVRAAHRGTVVRVGAHPVEVVANSGGEIRAYVRGPGAPPPDGVRMTVRVPDARGQRHPVMLVWSPEERAYIGRARRVEIAEGPIDVVMAYDGHRYEAQAPRYVIVQAARPAAAEVIEVEDEGGVVVEDPRPTVVVERPARPTVVVERPSAPTVVVQRPSRPTIVVERPQPTVVIERPRPVVVVERPRPAVIVVEEREIRERHGKFKHRGRGRGHGRGHDDD